MASPRKDFYYWAFAEFMPTEIRNTKFIKQREAINYGGSTILLERPELYDLNADISEKYHVRNLPDVVSDLMGNLQIPQGC